MKFKPFSPKYDFSKSELTENYPTYLFQPLRQWFYNIIRKNDLGTSSGYGSRMDSLRTGFLNRLNTIFRESFPQDFDDFINKVFIDPELMSNMLALLLQNFATAEEAVGLEAILAEGGSAFAVELTDKAANQYTEGVYDLVKRVPEVVAKQAAPVLARDELIREAWRAFYSRNPDYEKTVNRCCDALEHLLRDKYEPKNTKPQLGMLIKNLQNSPAKLNFKGDSLLANKSDLLSLISTATSVRGNHTAGTGRKPTAEEAEFILHSTILIWQLHQGV